jgi:hypothetical protein
MPLTGGATDKFGNRYEGLWTVRCLLEILDERADAIRLEPPGDEGDGAEFWFDKNGIREYHQVKRQIGAEGRWQLKPLKDKNVLHNFWKILQADPNNICVFISGHSAYQLEEIADRVRRSSCLDEFKINFLKAEDQKKSFELLLGKSYWNCSEENAYFALKRTYTRTVDEYSLRQSNESHAFSLVEGNPATVVDVLAEYALQMVHHTLTAHEIWHHLETKHNLKRRQWHNDPHILAAIQNANESYLSPLQSLTIADKVIPREEANTVLQKIDANASVMVLGEAGVGKSGVMLQIVESLQTSGTPFLAFRVDTLSPTPNPKLVGEELGFLESPTNVLAAVAQSRKCVLLIDQLDAVSQTSGRNPEFFNCIEQIIKQARVHREMRLVIACRKFDLDNDRRFKQLIGEKGIATPIAIGRLSHQTIKDFLAKLRLDTAGLTNKQLDLLSIPLHLSLLVAVIECNPTNSFTFQTAKDLFDQFWEEKQKELRARTGNPIQWTKVVDALCDYISQHQEDGLSAPQRVVDDYHHDAQLMASEHVLIWSNHQISFFHQAFFDYAFARRFASRGKNLISFLLEREQHLSLRTQVRQILLYEHDDERGLYLKDLQEVLAAPNIRFHLKQLILSLLATLDDPTPEEWYIVAPLIESVEFSHHVWGLLRSSVKWFKLADSIGVITKWLQSEDENWIATTLILMSIWQKELPDRITELAEPYLNVSDAWNQRLTNLMRFADLSIGRKFFNLFLHLVDTGVYENAAAVGTVERDFWNLLYRLPDQDPAWACEAMRHYLDRQINSYFTRLNSESRTSQFVDINYRELFPDSQWDREVLTKSASKAPIAFVENLLPFMLRVMELTANSQEEQPWEDSVWRYRLYGQGHDLAHYLLENMEIALSLLAKDDSNRFWEIATSLRNSEFETVQYLLIRAYTANGQEFADEAVSYLCTNPKRLRTGYSICNGNVNAAHYWATRQLIQAVTPRCSADCLTHLEDILLNYFVPCVRDVRYLWYRKYPQFVLLDAIASNRISNKALRRLQELRRKYEGMNMGITKNNESIKIEPPTSIEAYLVPSPISQEAAEKMTDEQWLAAIEKYDYPDGGTRFEKTGELIGGAGQLSQVLENQVKKHPERFVKLADRIPDSANPAYFNNGILRGLAETDLEVDAHSLSRAIHRCHNLPNKPCGRSISWLVEKRPNLSWSNSILNILTCYAVNDPDPQQELWRTEVQGGGTYYGGDIHSAGINSTRGSAVGAIAKLIFADSDRTVFFQNSLWQIVRDSSLAVRSCAAETLIAVINYDRNFAVKLFQQLCDTDELLLGTYPVERFLYYTIQSHFQELKPILERAISSTVPSVTEVEATQACVISLVIESGHILANRCLSGTIAQRKAAAEVFGANFRLAEFREFCEQALIKLFNDSEEEVRKQASHCFFHLEKEQIEECTSLIEAFVESLAFVDGHAELIRALEKSTAKLPDITVRLCDRFIDVVGNKARDIRTSSVDAQTITKLLLQTYSQTRNQQLQSYCLDLVDRLSQMETYGLRQALDVYEDCSSFGADAVAERLTDFDF